MNRRVFIKDIIIALAALVLGVAGYRYFAQKKSADYRTVPLTLPVSQDRETGNWKTYRNGRYGFEFRYPYYLGDIPNNVSEVEVKSKSTDSLSLKIHPEPLDGFKYSNQPGGFSFRYDENLNKWIPDQEGVGEEFAPIKRSTVSGSPAYLVKTGDGATSYEIGYVESDSKKFVLEIVTSRNTSWTECIQPCPEWKPFSNNKTIETIIGSVEFY